MARAKEPERADEPVTAAVLADAALDPKKEADVAKAIAQLSPQEALHFLELLERAVKKRRIQLFGYLLSLFVLLAGTTAALYVVGSAEEGTFIGWVYFLPLLGVAVVLLAFGHWAKRVK